MTARATLQLNALNTTRTLSGLGDLYQQLGYPSEEVVTYSSDEIGLEGAAGNDVHSASLLSDLETGADLLQHWHFELHEKPNAFTIRRVTEQFVRRSGEYLLSFSQAQAPYPTVQFVKPRKELQADGKTLVRLSKLTVTPARPTAHDMSILGAILVTPTTTALQAHQKQIEAFSVECVTQKFYETYHKLFLHVMNVIREQNPGATIQENPARRIPLPGEQPTEDQVRALHAFTQRLLGRLLFLYFIQKKGWLDGNEHYITELYESTVGGGANFYRDALEPLYFETLNSPTPRAGGLSGNIPYLNGSLFEREYPGTTVLNLPDSLFDPRRPGDGTGDPGGILHVLNSFNFTVGESAALEQDISLDPEMLGKVFENLMEETEAAQSGTFYTPRSIVQFMAEETLTRYLHDHTGIAQERLLNLVADDSEAHDLTLAEANNIKDALSKVRVLDPAVGTASMLVGFLNAMIRVRRSAEAKRGNQVTPGSPALADWKREYIQNCLYGVDIKHEAIEIARLRLWLSLVVDAQEPEPLPNLDYKLMAGDGLLETVDGSPFIKTQSMIVGGQGLVTAKADEIGRLHEHFFHEQDHERKRELRADIQQCERELFKLDIDDRIKNLDLELTALNRQIADPRQSEAASKKLTKRYNALYENLEALMQQRKKVWDDKEPLPFFLHNVHFSEVMKGMNGGFDIVIGNPPYVRHERLGKDQKAALQNAFPDVGSGTADLYVYFYQKGLNLLREGGRLAFITPNKFMRAGYGAKLREQLSRNTKLELLADFGDLPVFDATTYPLINIFKKAKPDGHAIGMLPERTLKAHLVDKLAGGVNSVREGLNAFHIYARDLLKPLDSKALTGSEWTLDDPRVLKLMEKLRGAGRPLGEVVEGKFYYGIKTGFNEAFVIDEAKRIEIISSDPKSAEIIKPFIRGKDVRRWKIDYKNKYLIYMPWKSNENSYPAIISHLKSYKDELSRRPEVIQGRFKWYELSRYGAEYIDQFSRPYLVWPGISETTVRFSYTDVGYYGNDNTHFIPDAPNWLLGVLNSRVTEFILNNICDQVQNSYWRIKILYVGQLPIPTPTPEQAARLAEFTDDSRLDELNALVYELYGLHPGEIELIEELTAGAYGAGNPVEGSGDEADDGNRE